MTVYELVNGITRNAFEETFHEEIRKLYSSKIQNDDLRELEEHFESNRYRLASFLPPELAEALQTIDQLYEEGRCYAASFSVKRGLFSGFQQYFGCSTDTDAGFEILVCNDLLKLPTMEQYHTFHKFRVNSTQLENKIRDSIPEHCVDLCNDFFYTLEQRVYSACHLGFFCGYCLAYSIIEHAAPLAIVKNISNILTTEYYLGFARPYLEDERLSLLSSR